MRTSQLVSLSSCPVVQKSAFESWREAKTREVRGYLYTCALHWCTHVHGPHSVALIIWLQFEEWKAGEEEAIKREKQKAIKLTKSLELASAQEKRWEFAHHLFYGGGGWLLSAPVDVAGTVGNV